MVFLLCSAWVIYKNHHTNAEDGVFPPTETANEYLVPKTVDVRTFNLLRYESDHGWRTTDRQKNGESIMDNSHHINYQFNI